jgi:hypothetical protein
MTSATAMVGRGGGKAGAWFARSGAGEADTPWPRATVRGCEFVVCVQGCAAGRIWARAGTRSAATVFYGRRLRAAGDSRDREGEALGRLRRRMPVRACVLAKVRAVSATEGSEARWWCGDVAVL